MTQTHEDPRRSPRKIAPARPAVHRRRWREASDGARDVSTRPPASDHHGRRGRQPPTWTPPWPPPGARSPRALGRPQRPGARRRAAASCSACCEPTEDSPGWKASTSANRSPSPAWSTSATPSTVHVLRRPRQHLQGATRSIRLPAFAYTRREPLGVVAAITPFNFPLILSSSKIAPALAAGNTVVHKPAEETPLSALLHGRTAPARPACPTACVNVVTGSGPVAGEALLRHPGVDKIAFTGSTAIGRHAASHRRREPLKPVTMELGGNAAQHRLRGRRPGEGASVRSSRGSSSTPVSSAWAARACWWPARCTSTVLSILAEAVPGVPVGDPPAPETVVGPMAGDAAPGEGRGVRRPGPAEGAGSSAAASGSTWTAATTTADGDRRPRRTTPGWCRRRSSARCSPCSPSTPRTRPSRWPTPRRTASRPGCRPTNLARAHRVAGPAPGRHRLGQRLGDARPGGALRRGQGLRLRPRVRPRGPRGVPADEVGLHPDRLIHSIELSR